MQKLCQIFIGLLIIFFVFPINALADGIIIPIPPICDVGPCPPPTLPMSQLDIRYHKVTVQIEDQIAVTHVENWGLEFQGIYISNPRRGSCHFIQSVGRWRASAG